MATVIHKKVIDFYGFGITYVPIGTWAEILDFQCQDGKLVVWYQFEKERATGEFENFPVHIHATGSEFNIDTWDTPRIKHFKTIIMGPLVIHIFIKPIGSIRVKGWHLDTSEKVYQGDI